MSSNSFEQVGQLRGYGHSCRWKYRGYLYRWLLDIEVMSDNSTSNTMVDALHEYLQYGLLQQRRLCIGDEDV